MLVEWIRQDRDQRPTASSRQDEKMVGKMVSPLYRAYRSLAMQTKWGYYYYDMKHFHWFSTRKFPMKLTAGHRQLEQSALIWRWELGLFCLRCALWVIYYSIIRTGNARVRWCIFSGCHPQGTSESGVIPLAVEFLVEVPFTNNSTSHFVDCLF